MCKIAIVGASVVPSPEGVHVEKLKEVINPCLLHDLKRSIEAPTMEIINLTIDYFNNRVLWRDSPLFCFHCSGNGTNGACKHNALSVIQCVVNLEASQPYTRKHLESRLLFN